MIDYQQIAAKAGVSRMTVSRALRNAPGISDKTRSKIIGVAKELGYKPNPLLSAWMSHVTGIKKRSFEPVLYYIVRIPDSPEALKAVLNGRYFAPAKIRAAELGFRLEVMMYPPDMDSARISKILRARNCPGVIISPYSSMATDTLELNWDDFIAITMGYSLTHPCLHRVCLNHAEGIISVLTELAERKMVRIGYALSRFSDELVRHLKVSSYLGFRFRHPELEMAEPLFVEDLDLAKFRLWFNRHRPDAMIVSEPVVFDWIEEVDKRPPNKRCRIVHLDEDYANDSRIYGVMRSKSTLIGKTAAELLVSLVRNNERGIPEDPQTILVPTEFAELSRLAGKQGPVREIS